MINSIIKPKEPIAGQWEIMDKPAQWVSMGYEANAFFHPATSIRVISALEVATDGDGKESGPEFHISISKEGMRRVTTQEAMEVVRMFGMDGAIEDNHVPGGIVRNFWRPVAEPFVGKECECKDEEPAIVEDKGDYVWRGVTK